MSFEFTVLPDERFIEILEAWVDSPWPKTTEDGYALRDRFGWTPSGNKPNVFTSDVVPDELSASFTSRQGVIGSFDFLLTILRLRRLGGTRWSQRRGFIGISVTS